MLEPRTDNRLLIYEVGGQSYASPLEDLREVVDIDFAEDVRPAEAGTGRDLRSVRVHRKDVLLAPLEEVLHGEPPREALTRPILVVAVGSNSVGLVVDQVHGMVPAESVYALPDGMSRFPRGFVKGLYLRRLESGGSSQQARKRGVEGTSLEEWVRDHDDADEDEPTARYRYQMVLVVDLGVLGEASLNAILER